MNSKRRRMFLLIIIALFGVDFFGSPNGAKVLDILDETGTVEAGKRAYLVILQENPIKDIRNTREIETVIKAGVFYSLTDLPDNMRI